MPTTMMKVSDGPDRRTVGGAGAAHTRGRAQSEPQAGASLEDPREVLNGILWVLRTGAPWKDLPERYPPYQTCHRRFQRRVRIGVMEAILRALAEDLKARGGLNLEECFIDGTFVVAKKGAMGWERPNGAGVRSSWQWQTAPVFLSRYASQVLAHMK